MGPVDKIWRGRVIHAGEAAPPIRRTPGVRSQPARAARTRRRPRQPRRTSSPLAITTSGNADGEADASRSAHVSSSGRSRLAATTGAHTTGSLRRSWRPHLDRHAVDPRVVDRRLDARRVVVERHHRIPSEPRRRDREHARSAAEVDETSRPPPARASARGTAASSRGSRSRTPAPGRSRSQPEPQSPPPTAAGQRADRRARAADETTATAGPSRRRPRTSGPRPAPRRRRRSDPAAPATRPARRRPRTRPRPQLTSTSSTPARRDRQQLGEHDLGPLAVHANRETDHRDPRPTRRTRASASRTAPRRCVGCARSSSRPAAAPVPAAPCSGGAGSRR